MNAERKLFNAAFHPNVLDKGVFVEILGSSCYFLLPFILLSFKKNVFVKLHHNLLHLPLAHSLVVPRSSLHQSCRGESIDPSSYLRHLSFALPTGVGDDTSPQLLAPSAVCILRHGL